ncbi:MAG: hypothetical protein WBK67_00540 [Minisyncoccales bacterium]
MVTYAIHNGSKWLSGDMINGKNMPVLTDNDQKRYEYASFEDADNAITELWQTGYAPMAETLTIVQVNNERGICSVCRCIIYDNDNGTIEDHGSLFCSKSCRDEITG